MSDRVREAIEIAREHLEWCGKHGIYAGDVMKAIGIQDPGPRRVGRGSLRLEVLAAAWLALTKEQDDERRAA